ADVAVAEVGSEDELIVRANRQPAQLRGPPSAGVDLREGPGGDPAVRAEGGQSDPVAHGGTDDEVIRPMVQESRVERRAASRVVERTFAKRTVLPDWKHDEPVRVGRVGRDRLR